MKKRIVLVLALVVLVVLAVWNYKNLKTTAPAVPAVTPQVGLIVNMPKANDVVTSPVTISGYVNGDGWNGFEGQVGSVKLVDSAGHVLAQGPLTATTEWTTTMVNFATSLQFTSPATKIGSLIFRNENPSGLPERDKQFILPIKF